MQDSLLWVYEGQDQFWGNVLAARSGVQTKDMVLGAIAAQAGYYSVAPGREWRSVEDTTFDPIIDKRKPQPYTSLNRNEDYYNEGMLIWLEADQVIRDGTRGKKGLDDFVQANYSSCAEDLDNDKVFMARNQFILDYTRERAPGISFTDIKDVKDKAA